MNAEKFVAGITIKGGLVYSYFAMNETDFLAVWSRFYTPNGLDIFGRGGFDTQEQALEYALETNRTEAFHRGCHDVPIPNTLDLTP